MRDLTLTLLQSTLAWQDPAANRASFTRLIDRLERPGELIVLPEMFTTGFTMNPAASAEPMDGPTLGWMAATAARSTSTLCGSLVITEDGRYYNRLLWMRPDGSYDYYDKRHLFRMAGEHEQYAAGSKRLVVTLGDWRICPLICYDLRFPVWSRGANAFDLQLYIANWPRQRRSAWQALLPARAIENQCYVAGVNRVGPDGNGVDHAGDSAVYDYFGQLLASAGESAQALTVTLDGAALARYRDKFPAWRDADRFELER